MFRNSQLVKKLKRVLDIGLVYFLGFFYWKDSKTKFVIFAQGRTGSTLLVDLLNQIECVHCDEELLSKEFFPFRWKTPFPFIYLLGNSRKYSNQIYGFKFKIYHLTEHQKLGPKYFLNKLAKTHKIIHLVRKDVPYQVISNLMAFHNKKYHVYPDERYEFNPIYINPEDFRKRINRRVNYYSLEKKLLKNINHLSLNYEKDLLDRTKHQDTIDRICLFLNIDSNRVEAKTVKSNIYSDRKIIINYQEIENIKMEFYRNPQII